MNDHITACDSNIPKCNIFQVFMGWFQKYDMNLNNDVDVLEKNRGNRYRDLFVHP
jgi:hypothetical protein